MFTLLIAFCNENISDEGVAQLAKLPKLEFLEFYFNKSITNQAFRHFTNLKKVSFSGITTVLQEAIRILLQSCSNLEEISLSGYSSDEIVGALKCAAETLRERNHIGSPLLLNLFYNCKARIFSIRSENDTTTKLMFQISYYENKYTPDFITFDLNEFLIKISWIIK